MAKAAKVLLNVPAIKADFPIFQRTVRDRRLVYLDSAATSQKPKQVIDSMTDYYTRYNANVHRAIYELGEEATREYEGAREKVAAFIQAKSPNEIVFTKCQGTWLEWCSMTVPRISSPFWSFPFTP